MAVSMMSPGVGVFTTMLTLALALLVTVPTLLTVYTRFAL